jgi:hypothetical protein
MLILCSFSVSVLLVPNLNNVNVHNNVNQKRFPKLNFSCQNVCSLNISKPGKKNHAKLLTVTKNGSEIIFLCDTRLNSNIQIAGVNDIEKKCRFLGFSLFHNSNINSRGTAILISNKVKYAITDSFSDENCNMLLLKVKIANVTITIGSIYGPNTDDETFYVQLR